MNRRTLLRCLLAAPLVPVAAVAAIKRPCLTVNPQTDTIRFIQGAEHVITGYDFEPQKVSWSDTQYFPCTWLVAHQGKA